MLLVLMLAKMDALLMFWPNLWQISWAEHESWIWWKDHTRPHNSEKKVHCDILAMFMYPSFIILTSTVAIFWYVHNYPL